MSGICTKREPALISRISLSNSGPLTRNRWHQSIVGQGLAITAVLLAWLAFVHLPLPEQSELVADMLPKDGSPNCCAHHYLSKPPIGIGWDFGGEPFGDSLKGKHHLDGWVIPFLIPEGNQQLDGFSFRVIPCLTPCLSNQQESGKP